MNNFFRRLHKFLTANLKFEVDKNLFVFLNIFLIMIYMPWVFLVDLGQSIKVDIILYSELVSIAVCFLFIVLILFLKNHKYEKILSILVLLISLMCVTFITIFFFDISTNFKPVFYRVLMSIFLLCIFVDLRFSILIICLSFFISYFITDLHGVRDIIDDDYASEIIDNHLILTNAALTVTAVFLVFIKIYITKNKINIVKSFANAIAHEAYGPVSIFKVKSEILIDDIKKNKKINYFQELEEMNNIAKYCMNNIDMILTATKNIDKDFHDVENYSSLSLVDEAIDDFYMEDKFRKRIHINRSKDLVFNGSKHLFKHVILNLLKNSISHAGNFSKIDIFVENDNFIFMDDGIGIKKENINEIFSADYSTGGIGIGLNFCLNAIRNMKGSIRCESEYGKYTKFVISFS